MSEQNGYPTKHLSIRVPWHDCSWEGKVCENPRSNVSCLILDNVADNKKDDREEKIALKSLEEMPEKEWPPCVSERMAFMAPFSYIGTKTYPYTFNSYFKHIKDTPFHNSPYSAATIPFNWMLLKNLEEKKLNYNLDVDYQAEMIQRERCNLKSNWVNVYDNQKELLDCFFGQVKPEKSLCFFYAKKVPFVETPGRVLIGVGRVKKVGNSYEYKYEPATDIKAMIWDRNITHSIRPDFEDGFILPYHQAIKHLEENPDSDLNIEDIAVFAPEDKIKEFSFVTEHVSNDTAIDVLLACAESIKKISSYIDGPWNKCLKWIDDMISDVWKIRGPYPGLGPALKALGLDYGNFMAMEIQEIAQAYEDKDHWELVDECFKDPDSYLSPILAGQIKGIMQDVWMDLEEEELSLLKLLSRFDLTAEQADLLFNEEGLEDLEKHWGIKITYEDVLKNPYLIYELLRHTSEPVSFLTIDHGAFPEIEIQNKFPLPEESRISSDLDKRRIRALIIDTLERATNEGHSLLPVKEIIARIEERQLNPPCNINSKILKAAEKYFDNILEVVPMADGSKAYQLEYLVEIRNIIRDVVLNRIEGRNNLEVDWETELNTYLDKKVSKDDYKPNSCDDFFPEPKLTDEEDDGIRERLDSEEINARIEKAAALEEIANSRVSVLIGSAGCGKTTLLAALCQNEQIIEEGVLLLAPTGKAKVKMEEAIGLKAYTVAQFLFKSGRYDGETGRFRILKKDVHRVGGTVIIDEASMLTEEMLASLLDSITGYKRIIFVGDQHQLPPIGTGRPFVDIISLVEPESVEAKFPKVGSNYAELTVNRRQLVAKERRLDIEFANWFRGGQISPGEDDIFEEISNLKSSSHLKFVRWEKEADFKELLLEVLKDELKLQSKDDYKTFNKSIGAFGDKFDVGSAEMAECWQILSPVRNWKHGVMEINRSIHLNFKGGIIAYNKSRRIKPYPMGPEGIIRGEKVINVKNHNHKKYDFRENKPSMGYVANGEIGIVVRTFQDYALNIEFSSQKLKTFSFYNQHFEEGNEDYSIELAYALTVHKAQGSEFGKVILIIPDPCPLVSRELIYTALTRQKRGIVLLHQGNPFDLLKYSSPEHSQTLERYTNLFYDPKPRKVKGKFLEENLIHTTSNGEAVRSKSEVIIADRLAAANIDYAYEEELVIDEVPKYPDFTIYDKNDNAYYWEHLGMLSNPEYKRRWENKLQWYNENGIKEDGGEKGTLIITTDDERGGISSQEIDRIIDENFRDKSRYETNEKKMKI